MRVRRRGEVVMVDYTELAGLVMWRSAFKAVAGDLVDALDFG
jgi:hypothetical protein